MKSHLLFWFLGVVMAMAPLTIDCSSHVLGPQDTSALKDDLQLSARIYRDMDTMDAGRDRAYARGVYCDERGVLVRSNAAPDGGPIVCPVTP